MTEFGLFNDEGCVEAGFFSKQEAELARTERYSPEDELDVLKMCPEHDLQPAAFCEECE